MHSYSVTINLPPELQESLERITEAYCATLEKMKTKYIQSYEYGKKDNKKHAHIGYLAPKQKTTSNETKKFVKCYEFNKKQHPKAIKHVSHDNWTMLIGYIAKEAPIEDIRWEGYPEKYILTCKQKYLESKQKTNNLEEIVKYKQHSVNEIAELFCKYYQEQRDKAPHDRIGTDWYDNTYEEFFSTIKKHLLYTTFQRINQDKLIQFAKINYDQKKHFI